MPWVDEVTAKKPFTPRADLSLIRPYSRGLQREAPYQNPYITHFHHGDKHLHYVAASHVHGSDNDTFRTVRAAVEKGDPELIIIEGVETKLGPSPAEYIDHVTRSAANQFATAGEPEYAAHLAMQKSVPFIGGEPTDAQIVAQMQEKGYSAKDVMAFYLLRAIPQAVEAGRLTAANLDEKIQSYIDHTNYYRDEKIPPADRLTVAEFKAWYAAHNDQPARDLLHIQTQSLAPIRSPHASYFETMSADTGEIREKHLDTLIADSFKTHDRVLVVYGGGHLVQSRKLFENMFGQSEDIKLS